MRTFRLPLAGAVILSLLIGMAVAVAAETVTIPDGAADRISGELVEAVHVSGPEPAPGLPGVTHNKWQYEVEWDEAIQLPTRATLMMAEDLHFMAGPDDFAVVCWGSATFEDENGYMVGPIRGFVDEHGVAQVQAMLADGGDYAGLNAILTGPIGGPGGGPLEGLLFEGYMPRT